MKHWLLMFRPETYEVVRSKGVIGVLKAHRKRFAELSKGDPFIAYISRKRVFDGWGKLSSAPYEDDSPLYPTKQSYPHRCKVQIQQSGMGRPEDEALWFLSAFDSDLKTTPSNMIFCKGGFYEISKSDFEALRAFMKSGVHPRQGLT